MPKDIHPAAERADPPDLAPEKAGRAESGGGLLSTSDPEYVEETPEGMVPGTLDSRG